MLYAKEGIARFDIEALTEGVDVHPVNLSWLETPGSGMVPGKSSERDAIPEILRSDLELEYLDS